ncbi:aminoglycoside phosphotransferase family protein [Spiribacter onubensis]|uniref:Phosphotransferase n=1 Tax=Spiribacter onubensis TaxID=3122420 RepID=A0ABV3S5P0_9GAMM
MDGQTGDERDRAMADWLAQLGMDPARLRPLGADASTRRYFRLMGPEGPRVVMDAPAQAESCEAFLRVQRLMAGAGLHVPRVEAADSQQGFMLLEDLGDDGYLAALSGPDRRRLLDDALHALVRWQAATRPDALPRFGAHRLASELALFPTWYVERHLGVAPDAEWWRRWQAGSAALIGAATAQPQVWVHRDFMARNLLVSDPSPGIIDFQDALLGPVTYDLASLLRDAFFSLDPAEEADWIERYRERAGRAGVRLPDNPVRALDLMAAQRHLKVLGIFARLRHRDDKPRYVADAPRFLAYLERELRPYPAFQDLADLVAALPPPPPAAAST